MFCSSYLLIISRLKRKKKELIICLDYMVSFNLILDYDILSSTLDKHDHIIDTVLINNCILELLIITGKIN